MSTHSVLQISSQKTSKPPNYVGVSVICVVLVVLVGVVGAVCAVCVVGVENLLCRCNKYRVQGRR